MKKIRKALISVSNKKDLGFVLKNLKKYKIEVISSGGTYKENKKVEVINVQNYQSILVLQKF